MPPIQIDGSRLQDAIDPDDELSLSRSPEAADELLRFFEGLTIPQLSLTSMVNQHQIGTCCNALLNILGVGHGTAALLVSLFWKFTALTMTLMRN